MSDLSPLATLPPEARALFSYAVFHAYSNTLYNAEQPTDEDRWRSSRETRDEARVQAAQLMAILLDMGFTVKPPLPKVLAAQYDVLRTKPAVPVYDQSEDEITSTQPAA